MYVLTSYVIARSLLDYFDGIALAYSTCILLLDLNTHSFTWFYLLLDKVSNSKLVASTVDRPYGGYDIGVNIVLLESCSAGCSADERIPKYDARKSMAGKQKSLTFQALTSYVSITRLWRQKVYAIERTNTSLELTWTFLKKLSVL